MNKQLVILCRPGAAFMWGRQDCIQFGPIMQGGGTDPGSLFAGKGVVAVDSFLPPTMLLPPPPPLLDPVTVSASFIWANLQWPLTLQPK